MNPSHPPFLDEKDSEASYHRILPLILALPPNRIRRVKESVPRAVVVVLSALPHLQTLRPRIDPLPEFDATVCDRIEDLALGLLHAHNLWLATSAPHDGLDELVHEGVALRKMLLHAAGLLIRDRLISPSTLKSLALRYGHEHVANDLRCLSGILRNSWMHAEGRCGFPLEQLEYAEKLALCIDRLRGLRAHPPKTALDEARDIRARAFTLLVNAYDQVQRAVTFLLGDDPSRSAAFPPLYRGRSRKHDTFQATDANQ